VEGGEPSVDVDDDGNGAERSDRRMSATRAARVENTTALRSPGRAMPGMVGPSRAALRENRALTVVVVAWHDAGR